MNLPLDHTNVAVKCTIKTATRGMIEQCTLVTATAEVDRYLNTSPQKVVERPKEYIDSESPNSPMRITGLRPT